MPPARTVSSAGPALGAGSRAARERTDAQRGASERSKGTRQGHGESRYAMLTHMADSPQRAPSRDLLLANHSFPGEYVVKAFGPSSERFRLGVHSVARAVFGEERAQVLERTSRGGGRVCITLTVNARSVDEVIEVYERIHDVDDLMLIL
jgi:putative lipoic acid-binding regulatory protein